MSAPFTLILVVVGAYLAAHVAFGWLAKRFMIVSGAEYLLLGVLLGPQVSQLISTSVFGGFAPFMTLSLGWIGALVGAQFYLPELIRISAVAYRVAFFEAVTTVVVVGAAMLAVFHWVLDMPVEAAVVPALVAGAIATASSPAAIALVGRRIGYRHAVVRQVQLTAAVDAVVAITVFGLVLAIDQAAPAAAVRPPTGTEWAVISVAIGVVGGILFHLFLGDERKIDRLFIALAGAVILVSGAASYVRLSPLLPAMLVGVILVNTSASRTQIRQALATLERPIYFVLLIFAGAAWQPSERAWVIPVVVFLAARMAAKVWGARVLARLNGVSATLGPRWGRALLGQGGLAVAIGLNYVLLDRTVLPHVLFTAVLISVLVTDLTSARVAEGVTRAVRRAPGEGGEGSPPMRRATSP